MVDLGTHGALSTPRWRSTSPARSSATARPPPASGTPSPGLGTLAVNAHHTSELKDPGQNVDDSDTGK
jgi:hypothetical protein